MRIALLGLVGVFTAFTALAADDHSSVYKKDVAANVVFKTSTTANGQPIHYNHTDDPEATMLQVEIPAGKETGWHQHPVSGYAYILSGQLTVQLKDGSSSTFGPGQGFAEVISTAHNGKNLGTEPVKLVVVFTGTKSQPFTIKE
ncbi:cupin domain-containing protein [Deefgea sp. CFH1-16]|uniref:cupin domain-containing protein n=1 Tax=Deefgea sp. CFH1-16 TaxID=2675457 RepID=UPI0015F657BE|nr:cupin domain-containing protein [Deefgea sp. CFH1-16]MBM5574267.1 cupin domain-containing protein [Deefgea sp. CFH1-16]